jgi:steroid delta-isomerase-like uncharacterized protein
MSSEANKSIVRRWYEEVFSQGNFDLIPQLFSADWVNHDPSGPPGGWPVGLEGATVVAGAYRTAFPDIKITIDDQVAEGDRVVTRWTTRGTNTGSLMGMPATGRPATITGISIERIAGGKIAETWVNFDGMGMMMQLGMIPAPGAGS